MNIHTNIPILLTLIFCGTFSDNNLRLMVQLMREKADSFSSSERGGAGTMDSLIQIGRRGYVPVVSTSIAGARLKLGVLYSCVCEHVCWCNRECMLE